MAIEEGKKAPLFTLPDHMGKKVALRELKGKNVVLFFYPKDNTPGCTKEACGFRDIYQAIRKKAVIFGVSMDDAASHKKFRKEHKLPFKLLTDANHKVMEKYEAYGEKKSFGKTQMGVIRSTVWIDENGKVAKHWRKVSRAAEHPQQVLNALTAT